MTDKQAAQIISSGSGNKAIDLLKTIFSRSIGKHPDKPVSGGNAYAIHKYLSAIETNNIGF
ncbi:MAG: hypothetical protein ACRCXT_01615 [Paraclostridium sp.]